MDILVLLKRIGTLFVEVDDLSRQMADATGRQDEVSMQMVLAMRSEPIERLTIADAALREHIEALGEDRQRVRQLLGGDASAAQNETEKMIAEQAASNLRMHKKILEMDKVLNLKIAKDKSIYQ